MDKDNPSTFPFIYLKQKNWKDELIQMATKTCLKSKASWWLRWDQGQSLLTRSRGPAQEKDSWGPETYITCFGILPEAAPSPTIVSALGMGRFPSKVTSVPHCEQLKQQELAEGPFSKVLGPRGEEESESSPASWLPTDYSLSLSPVSHSLSTEMSFKSHHLKVYNSVTFSVFLRLCNQNHEL